MLVLYFPLFSIILFVCLPQLYIYGFLRIQHGPHRGAFYHPHFVRGNRQLALTMDRNQNSSNSGANRVGKRLAQELKPSLPLPVPASTMTTVNPDLLGGGGDHNRTVAPLPHGTLLPIATTACSFLDHDFAVSKSIAKRGIVDYHASKMGTMRSQPIPSPHGLSKPLYNAIRLPSEGEANEPDDSSSSLLDCAFKTDAINGSPEDWQKTLLRLLNDADRIFPVWAHSYGGNGHVREGNMMLLEPRPIEEMMETDGGGGSSSYGSNVTSMIG